MKKDQAVKKNLRYAFEMLGHSKERTGRRKKQSEFVDEQVWMRQKVIKFDPPQFSADRAVGVPLAKTIWHGLMCPLAQALQKSQTLPHTCAVTQPGQSCGISTKNTATVGLSMVFCLCMCSYVSLFVAFFPSRDSNADAVPVFILVLYLQNVCI